MISVVPPPGGASSGAERHARRSARGVQQHGGGTPHLVPAGGRGGTVRGYEPGDQVLQRLAVALPQGGPLALSVVAEDDDLVRTRCMAERTQSHGSVSREQVSVVDSVVRQKHVSSGYATFDLRGVLRPGGGEDPARLLLVPAKRRHLAAVVVQQTGLAARAVGGY